MGKLDKLARGLTKYKAGKFGLKHAFRHPVAALAAAGGAWYFYKRKDKKTSRQHATTSY